MQCSNWVIWHSCCDGRERKIRCTIYTHQSGRGGVLFHHLADERVAHAESARQLAHNKQGMHIRRRRGCFSVDQNPRLCNQLDAPSTLQRKTPPQVHPSPPNTVFPKKLQGFSLGGQTACHLCDWLFGTFADRGLFVVSNRGKMMPCGDWALIDRNSCVSGNSRRSVMKLQRLIKFLWALLASFLTNCSVLAYQGMYTHAST